MKFCHKKIYNFLCHHSRTRVCDFFFWFFGRFISTAILLSLFLQSFLFLFYLRIDIISKRTICHGSWKLCISLLSAGNSWHSCVYLRFWIVIITLQWFLQFLAIPDSFSFSSSTHWPVTGQKHFQSCFATFAFSPKSVIIPSHAKVFQ